MTTVLEICRAAADELSAIRPTSIEPTSLEPTAQKLSRHLTRTCRDLSRRYDWQTLRREHTFTSSGVVAQSGAIPSDFLRFVKETMFNRTRRTKVLGPLTPMEWQKIQASVYTNVYDHFIQRGNSVLFAGTMSSGDTIAFEYITKNIGMSSAGTPAELAAFTNDNDTTFFDDELLISGIVWRYLKAERQDYSEEFAQHERLFADLTKMDGGRRVLDMGGGELAAVPIPPATGDTIVDLTSL